MGFYQTNGNAPTVDRIFVKTIVSAFLTLDRHIVNLAGNTPKRGYLQFDVICILTIDRTRS